MIRNQRVVKCDVFIFQTEFVREVLERFMLPVDWHCKLHKVFYITVSVGLGLLWI
jgi:hypothetical protein